MHTTVRRPVRRVDLSAGGHPVTVRPDTLAVEEPLEIRVNGEPFAVTMRTPGHDLELALGFLLGEGVIAGPQDVSRGIACGDTGLEITLAPGVDPPARGLSRRVSSACGVCGTEQIDLVLARSGTLPDDDLVLDAAVLTLLPDALRQAQRVFDRTGGLHAAGLFTADGTRIRVREDVGRHNAVDKVVGHALTLGELPLAGHVLQVSGRASFELVQKAVAAGIPVLAAVSAPSSLAVDLAERAGMTLVGFSRADSFNVYAGAQRIRT